MNKLILMLLALSALALGCVEDDFLEDFVEPEIRISGPDSSLEVDETFQFTYRYFNNIGQRDDNVPVTWTSQNPDIMSINSDGLATALTGGTTTITGTVEIAVSYTHLTLPTTPYV